MSHITNLTLQKICLASIGLLVLLGGAQAQNRVPNDYSKDENWLCRGDKIGACDTDLTTTILKPNGEMSRETWQRNADAKIDCFYVYPTISEDQSGNSDMDAGPEEKRAIQQQLARFGSECRLYAPIYRQATLAALASVLAGSPMQMDWMLPYYDVLDAWKEYLKNDNKGRGVVLIGHSQGAKTLIELMQAEIDGRAIQKQLVSALVIGYNLPVAKGKDIGETFLDIPLCRSADQIGCVISYVAYRANSPPTGKSFLGLTGGGTANACTNPAALAGGSGELKPYFSAKMGVNGRRLENEKWNKQVAAIDTPYVAVPGRVKAECVNGVGFTYLAITPDQTNGFDVPGDVVVGGEVYAHWGLHLVDINLGMGNLLEIVRQQGKRYQASR